MKMLRRSPLASSLLSLLLLLLLPLLLMKEEGENEGWTLEMRASSPASNLKTRGKRENPPLS